MLLDQLYSFGCCSFLKVDGQQLFSHRVPQHWTPRSGRNFLPSVAAALGYPEADKDLLGAWSAKASDRHSRLAMKRITAMQLAIAKRFGPSRRIGDSGKFSWFRVRNERP